MLAVICLFPAAHVYAATCESVVGALKRPNTKVTSAAEVAPGAFVYMAPKLTHGISAKTPLMMLLYLHKAARES